MSSDRLVFGTDEIEIIEYIEHARYVPLKVYDLSNAAEMLSDEEVEKVKRYIERITNKRVKPWFLPKSLKEIQRDTQKILNQKHEEISKRFGKG